MTKAETAERISIKTGIQKQEVEKILEAFFVTVKDSVSSAENIYIRGFGSFITKQRAQKIARNISKGSTMIIPAQVVPHFKPSNEFISQVKEAVLVS